MEWFARLKLGTPVFYARKEGNEPTCCPHSCIFAEYHSQLCIMNWNPTTETKNTRQKTNFIRSLIFICYFLLCTVYSIKESAREIQTPPSTCIFVHCKCGVMSQLNKSFYFLQREYNKNRVT